MWFVVALGMSPYGHVLTNLADDSHAWVPVYRVAIVWGDHEREVEVLAMGSRPLLGTELLAGHNLSADFEQDGELTITPL